MKKIIAFVLMVVLFSASAIAAPFFWSGGNGGGGDAVLSYTVATLPGAPTDGDLAVVTDGADASDCTVGSGAVVNLCVYDAGGTAWVIVGDGGGAGNSFSTHDTATNAAGTSPVAGAADTLTWFDTAPIVITGDSVADSITVSITAATDTAVGVLEIATDAEGVTATATDRIVTPANVAAILAAPSAIGGTTPAAGKFTTLESTDAITVGGDIEVADFDMHSIDGLYGVDDDVYIDLGTDGAVTIEADTMINFTGPMDFGNEDVTSIDKLEGFDTAIYIDMGTDTLMEIVADARVDITSAAVRLEVDAAAYLNIATANAGATTISQVSDGTDQIIIGDGGDRVDIASDSWDVTDGAMSGVTTLGVGPITSTGTSTFQTAVNPAAAGVGSLGGAAAEWAYLYLHDSGVIYGQADQSNTLTSSATDWTANLDIVITGNDLVLGSRTAGVTLTGDGDGQLTIGGFGDGSDENITINLDDTANTAVFASGTALDTFDFSAINLTTTGTIGGGVITGTGFTIGSAAILEAELEIIDGATLTTTQLEYLNAATGTTGTASTNLVFSTSPALTTPGITGGATFTDANITPDANGELVYDNTVAGVDDGSFAYFGGTDTVYFMPGYAVLPTDSEDDYHLAYDKDTDRLYWKADETAGTPTMDNVGSPEAPWTPTLQDTEIVTWTTEQNTAGSVFLIDNTTADVTNNVYLLELQYTDTADVDADFIKLVDGSGTVLTIQEGGMLSIGADPGDSGIFNLDNAAVISWEDATETTLTHVDNTGLTLNNTFQAATLTDGTASLNAGAWTAITSLAVDDITINANSIVSGGASSLLITPTAGQNITFDGTVTLDAGVIAGATSITSTAFTGTLATAAQGNVTSLGTLTSLTVDDITINGNTISSAGASTLAIDPTAGQAITFDSTVTLDAGVVAGITSLSTGGLTATSNLDIGSYNITAAAFVPDTAANASGEIGYTSDAYNLFANSDSLTITNAANVWTIDSTADTIAFTPAVAFTSFSVPASANPAWTFSDSDAAAKGTATIYVDAVTAAQDSELVFKVDAGGSEDVTFLTVDGSTETLIAAKLITPSGGIKALTPVTDSTADFAANFTGANLYGGTFIANADDGDLVLPLMLEGMNFTVITLGAIEVVADTNAADGYLMDGTTGVEGANLTNLSTAGDIAVFQYYTTDDWLITTNGWTAE